MSVGVKFDKEKAVRPELIAPEIITALGEVLAYGANKYRVSVEEKFWRAVQPVAVTLLDFVDFVVPVTIKNSNEKTQSIESDKLQMQESGVNVIKTVIENPKELEIVLDNRTQSTVYGDEKSTYSLDTVSAQILLTDSWQKVVEFAKAQKTFTLTTTTKQGDLEEYCAVSTTTVLDSLETTLRVLRPHLITSATQNTRFLYDQIGAGNWALGMEWSRVYGAMLRHLNAWASGEDIDEESKLRHLAHASFGMMVLLAYSKRGIGIDDRVTVGLMNERRAS